MTDAERLARYDRLYAELLSERAAVLAELDRLRAAGRVRSATFRQQVARKLALNEQLARFEAHGLASPGGGPEGERSDNGIL